MGFLSLQQTTKSRDFAQDGGPERRTDPFSFGAKTLLLLIPASSIVEAFRTQSGNCHHIIAIAF